MSYDNEFLKLYKAKNAFIAGSLDSWAFIIEECPEMIPTIIKDMKDMALSLKKSAGVIILNDDTE